MILLCERCYAPIDDAEPVVRLAHIDFAHPDGSISWVHSYLHTGPCPAPRPAPRLRPDTGEWNADRGIGSRRGRSAA
jgi:hypothetical protein